ncbi:hypothetical protein, unlikely [Trypanosoma congolense IL3000]|uniref:Uncharacterized protein n=1 Tax=Trypanosoma congolense (strain IL3000) TaxID=1068625 RepID=F9WGL2_TRYCI|nr:hypothetical protein, unlikely [Trypanosoma congolense IL3000]
MCMSHGFRNACQLALFHTYEAPGWGWSGQSSPYTPRTGSGNSRCPGSACGSNVRSRSLGVVGRPATTGLMWRAILALFFQCSQFAVPSQNATWQYTHTRSPPEAAGPIIRDGNLRQLPQLVVPLPPTGISTHSNKHTHFGGNTQT